MARRRKSHHLEHGSHFSPNGPVSVWQIISALTAVWHNYLCFISSLPCTLVIQVQWQTLYWPGCHVIHLQSTHGVVRRLANPIPIAQCVKVSHNNIDFKMMSINNTFGSYTLFLWFCLLQINIKSGQHFMAIATSPQQLLLLTTTFNQKAYWPCIINSSQAAQKQRQFP